MEEINSLSELLPALIKAKSELKALTKSADNPYFKSKYVDLNTTLEMVEPILAAHGLIILQPIEQSSNGDVLVTTLIHESGQSISSSMSLILAKNDMQAAGSAVTYARRYTLQSLLALRAEDDDGEVAVGRSSGGASKSFSKKSGAPKAAPVAAASEGSVAKKESSFRPKLNTQPKTEVTPEPETGSWS